MNHFSKTLFSMALVAASGITAYAQNNTSGVIEYEVNAKMNRPGGDNEGDDQVITFKQHFYFTASKGKLETERPANFGGFGGRGGNRGNNPDGPPAGGPPAGGAGGNGPGGGNRGGGRMRFGGGGFGTQYVDLASKKYLQVMTEPDGDKKTYYAEQDYAAPKDVKLSDKTKKIAGYNCKRATVTLGEEAFTVWYTQDLPFSYSPVNGLLPESKGVVLAAESNRRTFTAKSVDLKAVADADISVPANAEKVSEDKLRELRRDMMQRFRERQNNGN